ncbi:MAG: hypothetical protein IH628_11055, partial [Proteobacteria bacterium]|nr:hypothetical protein [Pseudomonadota bacterium]
LKQGIEAIQKLNDLSRTEDLSLEMAPKAPAQLPVFSVPDDFNPASLVEDMLSSTQPVESNSILDPLAKFLERPEGRRMAEYSIKTAVNMQYRPLFDELGLPPETEEKIKEILQQYVSESINAGLRAFDKSADSESLQSMSTEREAKLREDLSQLLSPEELAQYDAYQATLPERMLGQSYETQLRMFHGDISEESIALVKQVLVEETLHLKASQDMPPADAVEVYAIQQEEAFSRALERLAPEISEEEYAAVEAFIKLQQELVDSVARVLDWKKPVPAQSGSR